MVHHEICPICSSADISLHLSLTDHFLSKEKFDLYRCSVCGLNFTNNYPEADNIGKYYESEDYISHSNTKKGFTNRVYHLARVMMLRRKRRIVTNVTNLKQGKLLDIGSGSGYFASEMKRKGWNVQGIEINDSAREASNSRFGLDIISPQEIQTLRKESFDCITLWHVLEHFHDPFRYASDILSLLKPGGICLVALPNSNSSDAIHYREFWAAYDVPRHLWHFNPDTFRRFTEKAGFQTVKLLPLHLDVFYISILSEKYKGSRLPLFTGIAYAKLYFILTLLNREKCSSIIYILRKPE